MREIKFRGQRADAKEWVYGDLYATSEIPMIVVDGIASEYENFVVVIPETIGQYTGLKDKNGKEIYEGDIVKSKLGTIGNIHYKNGAFVMSNENSNVYLLYDLAIEDGSLIYWEVIGNIY